MPELGSYGSVRGARGNSRPYRERYVLMLSSSDFDPISEMALFPFVPVRPIDYRVTQCVPLRLFRSGPKPKRRRNTVAISAGPSGPHRRSQPRPRLAAGLRSRP